MLELPVTLNPDETILRTEQEAAHVQNQVIGTGVHAGRLWLTSQRIVFQPSMFGSTVAYPLSHIRRASRSDTPIYSRSGGSGMAGRTTTYPASLYLEFDNGGQEHFIPKDIDGWVSGIAAAQGTAPSLPYTQAPPANSAVGKNRGLMVFGGIVAAIILLFLCSVMACFGLPLLLSLFGGQGG